MLNSSLCDYSGAYILVKGTITVPNTAAAATAANNADKKVIFKDCVPFTDCISEINNTLVDNAKDLFDVMPMNNLIERSDDYSKTSGTYDNIAKMVAVNDDSAIVNFVANDTYSPFKIKKKITGQTGDDGTMLK